MKRLLPLIVLLAAAFALRTLALADVPLAPSEAAHISLAILPLADLSELNRIWVRPEMPLSALLLRAWFSVAGVSVFSARILSAFVSMIGLAAAAAAAHRLKLNTRATVITVLALAIFPLHVNISRAVGGDVLAMTGLLLLAAAPPPSLVAGFFAGLLAFGGAWWALVSAPFILIFKNWKLAAGAVAGAVVWLAYMVPMRATFITALTDPRYIPDDAPRLLLDVPQSVLGGMILGQGGQPIVRSVVLVGIMLIALIGLVSLPQTALRFSVAGWAGMVMIGLAAFVGLAYVPVEIITYGMFPVALMLGAGLAQFNRRHTGSWGIVIVGCLGFVAAGIMNAEYDPDLRDLRAYFAPRARQNDAVLYSQPWEPGALATATDADLTFVADLTPAPTERLPRLIAFPGRIWEVIYEGLAQSPNNASTQYLLDNTAWDGGQTFEEADTELNLFVAPGRALNYYDEPSVCYDIDTAIITFCTAPFGTVRIRPGPIVFQGVWVLNQENFTNYSAYVHLVPTEGNPTHVDLIIGNRQTGTTNFPSGEPVEDLFFVDMTDVPAGQYDVEFGVFNPLSGAAALIGEDLAETITLGTIIIEPVD